MSSDGRVNLFDWNNINKPIKTRDLRINTDQRTEDFALHPLCMDNHINDQNWILLGTMEETIEIIKLHGEKNPNCSDKFIKSHSAPVSCISIN